MQRLAPLGITVVAAVVMTATSALATPVTVPTALNPGDQYRLVFVTSCPSGVCGITNATSADITHYNSIVNDDFGLPATGIDGWTAIASTSTVDAIDNTSTPVSTSGVPIYLLNDTVLANDYADLWDGTIDVPLSVDETGVVTSNPFRAVWTGTTSDGFASNGTGLGTNSPVGFYGFRDVTDSGWIAVGVNTGFLQGLRLYAISPVLTVPTTTINVAIDIKPGSDPNSINLCSNGAVPIAILGSGTFDVFEVNADSLRFAEASVKVVGKKDPHTLCSYEDVDGDLLLDLVCHFVTSDIAALDGESTTATLNGELLEEFGGTTIEGTDSVNIVKDTCY